MVDLDLVAIGARIRSLRGELTQAAFADRLGLERKTVGRYEGGERAPDALALLRLQTEFGADPAWVLSGSGVTPSALSAGDRVLLANFHSAPEKVQQGVKTTLDAFSRSASRGEAA